MMENTKILLLSSETPVTPETPVLLPREIGVASDDPVGRLPSHRGKGKINISSLGILKKMKIHPPQAPQAPQVPRKRNSLFLLQKSVVGLRPEAFSALLKFALRGDKKRRKIPKKITPTYLRRG